jgi:hypothetical protein
MSPRIICHALVPRAPNEHRLFAGSSLTPDLLPFETEIGRENASPLFSSKVPLRTSLSHEFTTFFSQSSPLEASHRSRYIAWDQK